MLPSQRQYAENSLVSYAHLCVLRTQKDTQALSFGNPFKIVGNGCEGETIISKLPLGPMMCCFPLYSVMVTGSRLLKLVRVIKRIEPYGSPGFGSACTRAST